MLQKDIKLIYSVSLIVSFTQTHAGSAGWLHALFPVTVFAKKKQIHRGVPGKKHTPPPESGNRAALLPPSPLRTVRAAFTAYSSSSLNAKSITRQQI